MNWPTLTSSQLLNSVGVDMFGNPTTATPNLLASLQSLTAPVTAPATTTPALAPSPFRYQPLSQSRGFGDYLGANMPLFSAGLSGLSQLGGLYLGLKQLGMARDNFNLNKRAFETNLANQIRSYNTQVSDRIAGRSYASEEERQAALRAAQLPMRG